MAVVLLAPMFGWSTLAVAGPPPVTPQAKMGDPLPGLASRELSRFNLGKIKYNLPLTAAGGLGPCFNKASCGNCHSNPLGGTGSQTVTRFGKAAVGMNPFDPLASLGGSLLQVSAISESCKEFVPPEADVQSFRVTNGALAYGLVEAIPDADLLANRDSQPLAVRGVAHMVEAFEDPVPTLHVGRFGWKAQVATVLTFSADASLNEMGLTNRFVTTENAPNGNMALLASCDMYADPEDFADVQGFHFIDRVTDFQRFLANAPQTPKSGMTGEAIFNAIGCAVCHTPSFTTSNSPMLETALRNKVIRPYSDFLLHDMGTNGDGIVQGAGTETMLKTPPLWGVRTRDPLWHDGRVGGGTVETRITATIALHDDGQGVTSTAQGRASAIAFAALSPSDQAKLIAFMDSLGRREFDADQTLEDVINIFDFVGFNSCFTGPGSFYTADSPCAIHDINQDGDVDLSDFDSFMLVYTGPRRDCNNNGIVDLRDILTGPGTDNNNNGRLDSCEPTCDSDVNGNNFVNVDDLLYVINHWGPCRATPQPCGADIVLDNFVNIDDLLAIINSWGMCPK